MLIQDLKYKWVSEDRKKDAINLWNEKADYFGSYELKDALDDKLIQIIKENNLIDKNSTILDVGCGAGKHCAALADECFKVVGTDLSPRMIEHAKRKARLYNKTNLEFRCDDWSKIDVIKEGLYKSFDLVIACMTPAISSYDTFEKFLSCSKNAGIYCTSTKRTDSVTDEIDKLIGVEKRELEVEASLTYAFSVLWEMGYYPKVEYINQTWDSEMQIEKAFNVYTSKIRKKYGMNEDQERILRRYIEDISENEIIHEKIEAKKAVIYWQN